jgi:hypothetical protein
VSHGAKLPAHLWRTCLWEILFPLLDTVRQLAAASSREESVGTQLGQDKGRAVMMLVHHSRNTEQKQWDETLVLSLNGMGRLLRSYLPVLSSLEGFDVRWDSFLAFFESSVVDGNREVAVAAIGSLTAILQGHAGTAALPRPLWKRAMKAYGAAVRGASQTASKVSVRDDFMKQLRVVSRIARESAPACGSNAPKSGEQGRWIVVMSCERSGHSIMAELQPAEYSWCSWCS